MARIQQLYRIERETKSLSADGRLPIDNNLTEPAVNSQLPRGSTQTPDATLTIRSILQGREHVAVAGWQRRVRSCRRMSNGSFAPAAVPGA